MIFTTTAVHGCYLIEMKHREDERGYFGRAWCADLFAEQGLNVSWVQANMSACRQAGIFRGLHYQDDTAPEAKLIRCIRGAIFDLVVDMRPDSPTFRAWTGDRLDADNRRAIYVPAGCAHGYLALEDGAEVFYFASGRYAPEAERGVRWDDPALAIDWPAPVLQVSEKDQNWPLLPPLTGK